MTDFIQDIMNVPLAYDTGVNITTLRKRKKRKCAKTHLIVVTEVMSSKEVSKVSGEILSKIMRNIIV